MAGLPLVHVLNLVIGDEPERLIYDFTPKVLAEPDRVVDGVSYRVLRLDESDNHDWRFLIDPKSGLLAFVDLVVEGDAAKSSIAGGDTHVESLRWAAGAISTEVPRRRGVRLQAPSRVHAGRPSSKADRRAEAKAEAPDAARWSASRPPTSRSTSSTAPDKLRKVTKADLPARSC